MRFHSVSLTSQSISFPAAVVVASPCRSPAPAVPPLSPCPLVVPPSSRCPLVPLPPPSSRCPLPCPVVPFPVPLSPPSSCCPLPCPVVPSLVPLSLPRPVVPSLVPLSPPSSSSPPPHSLITPSPFPLCRPILSSFNLDFLFSYLINHTP